MSAPEKPQPIIDLKALAEEFRRPLYAVMTMGANNDPFYITPARLAAVDWIMGIWAQLDITSGGGKVHIRRVHYRLVSLGNVLRPSRDKKTGEQRFYVNTDNSQQDLIHAIRDAIGLGLIDGDQIVDHKNPDPRLYLFDGTPAQIDITDEFPADVDEYQAGKMDIEDWTIDELPAIWGVVPKAKLTEEPRIAQRYHLEIWVEKSTVDDIVEPLGRAYGINVVTATGEISATACRDFIKRAKASHPRPCRILYVSDFDPAGDDMPISVSVKIQFELMRQGLDLDIQVRQIALTHAQVVELNLPRASPKESERRAGRFAERYGEEGAAELDALEALHPGHLRTILREEIRRYYDLTLKDRVAEAVDDLTGQIDGVNAEVSSIHAEALAELNKERDELAEELDVVREEWAAAVNALNVEFDERMAPIWDRIVPIWEKANLLRDKAREDLDERMPDLAEFEWPEGAEGDEDPDPLFDSKRPYIDQVDRFKRHQNKPTARKGRQRGQRKPLKQYDLTTVEGRKGAAMQKYYEANRESLLAKTKARAAARAAAKAAAKKAP